MLALAIVLGGLVVTKHGACRRTRCLFVDFILFEEQNAAFIFIDFILTIRPKIMSRIVQLLDVVDKSVLACIPCHSPASPLFVGGDERGLPQDEAISDCVELRFWQRVQLLENVEFGLEQVAATARFTAIYGGRATGLLLGSPSSAGFVPLGGVLKVS